MASYLAVNLRNSRYSQDSKVPNGVIRWVTNFADALFEVCKKENENILISLQPPRKMRSGVLGYLWEQFGIPFRLSSGQILISPAGTGPIFIRNQVVVIHDIGPIQHPELFNKKIALVYKLVWKILSKTCLGIITDSENQKTLILREFGIPESKVCVAGAGVICNYCKRDEILPRSFPYFLLVSGNISRKNLNFLLNIWNEIYRITGAKLVVTCSESSARIANTNSNDFKKYKEWIQIVNEPEDLEMHNLYSGCIAVLQPSVFEGYGLPLLEGLLHGKPFISSPVGAAPELAIEKCKVLNLDVEVWTEAIIQLAREDILSKSDSRKYIEWAKDNNWTKVAQKVVNFTNQLNQNTFKD